LRVGIVEDLPFVTVVELGDQNALMIPNGRLPGAFTTVSRANGVGHNHRQSVAAGNVRQPLRRPFYPAGEFCHAGSVNRGASCRSLRRVCGYRQLGADSQRDIVPGGGQILRDAAADKKRFFVGVQILFGIDVPGFVGPKIIRLMQTLVGWRVGAPTPSVRLWVAAID